MDAAVQRMTLEERLALAMRIVAETRHVVRELEVDRDERGSALLSWLDELDHSAGHPAEGAPPAGRFRRPELRLVDQPRQARQRSSARS